LIDQVETSRASACAPANSSRASSRQDPEPIVENRCSTRIAAALHASGNTTTTPAVAAKKTQKKSTNTKKKEPPQAKKTQPTKGKVAEKPLKSKRTYTRSVKEPPTAAAPIVHTDVQALLSEFRSIFHEMGLQKSESISFR
jgi:outer membrane biosynthesis protein TonB